MPGHARRRRGCRRRAGARRLRLGGDLPAPHALQIAQRRAARGRPLAPALRPRPLRRRRRASSACSPRPSRRGRSATQRRRRRRSATRSPTIVSLGIGHILTGYDHLVFLLGLLLLGGTPARRGAHRHRLHHRPQHDPGAGGVRRRCARRAAPIEALIGLSIALVATENLWLAGGRRRAVRWAIGRCCSLPRRRWPRAAAAACRRSPWLGLALFAACYFGLARAGRRARRRCAPPSPSSSGWCTASASPASCSRPSCRASAWRARCSASTLGVELGQVAAVLLLWPLLQLAWRVVASGALHRADHRVRLGGDPRRRRVLVRQPRVRLSRHECAEVRQVREYASTGRSRLATRCLAAHSANPQLNAHSHSRRLLRPSQPRPTRPAPASTSSTVDRCRQS